MAGPTPNERPSGMSFWKLVLVMLALIALALVLLVWVGGDDGALPFQYEGFD